MQENFVLFFFKWGTERRWDKRKGSSKGNDGDRETDKSKVNLLPAWRSIYYQGKGTAAHDPEKVLYYYRWHPKL